MSTVIIKGTYAQTTACVLVTRTLNSPYLSIQLSQPSVTLDAAGHHELLQALAFPPAQQPIGLCGGIIQPGVNTETRLPNDQSVWRGAEL